MICENCKTTNIAIPVNPIRVVEKGRTDNHYIEVCATCAIDLCEVSKTHRRIERQPEEKTQ